MYLALSEVTATVLAHRLQAVLEVDVRAELRDCLYPILYLRGRRDNVVPALNLRSVQQIRPDIQVAHLLASHMVLQTRPFEAARAKEAFVHECVGDCS